MNTVDVAVVGIGVMGAAAARSLARAGRDVVMLERFRIGHDRGSSHGPARIFRLSYHDRTYVEMARESYELWRALEEESGQPLLETTGGLDVADAQVLEAHVAALTSCGVPVEKLSAEAVAERFHAVAIPAGESTLFQADSGVLNAERAWRALAEGAVASGAVLREEEPVESIAEIGGMAEVRTGGETFRARVAIVTAGAWTRGLLEGAGIELPTKPTRETVAYFELGDRVPVMVEWRDPALYALQSGTRLKAAEHHAGPETDPNNAGAPDATSVERVSAWVRERFPTADPEPRLTETCIYTNTEDERFILERRGPFVIGSACSGHGFKFAPLIGERLAALASE